MAEPLDKYKKKGAVKCPECGNSQLILEDEKNIDIKCPRCEKGKLISFMTKIS